MSAFVLETRARRPALGRSLRTLLTRLARALDAAVSARAAREVPEWRMRQVQGEINRHLNAGVSLIRAIEIGFADCELRPLSKMGKSAGNLRARGWLANRSAEGAKVGGRGRTRTYEGVSQRIYSPPPLPLGTLSPRKHAVTVSQG